MTRRARTPILVLGLDGGSWNVLEPLMRAGLMPNLASLRSTGAWGNLASTVPPFTAPAWSTFMTGKDPGQHGVLSFFQQDASSYAMMPGGPLATSSAQHHRTLWDCLGTAGWRVGVINVPLTYPPQQVNGFMVSGLLTPIGAPGFTYPHDLVAELGLDYVVEPEYLRGIMGSFDLSRLPERGRLLRDLDQAEAVRVAASLALLARHRPDFFMLVFTSTDRLAHFFWDYLSAEETHHRGRDSELRDGVRAHFRRLDRWIGQLRAALGPESTLLLMSDHGFGPAATHWAHVNSWLQAERLLCWRSGVFANWRNPAFWKASITSSWLRRFIKSVLPERAQRVVRRAERLPELVDWSCTTAYFVFIYANVAGVMVNLQGRQPEGFVQPGDYEAVRDRIIAAAREWRSPETGELVVRHASRREDLYSGEHVSSFPDVILELEPDYTAVATLERATLSRATPSVRSGEHRPEGVFLAHGPAIRAGEVDSASIADLAPTILHLAGVPVPGDMVGDVLVRALLPDWLEKHPVQDRLTTTESGTPAPSAVYTAEEEALLTQHLAGLGYL